MIRQLRVDARSAQEEAEAVVAELARATRTLRDAILDVGRMGAQVRIECGSSVFGGRVVHVGDDVVRLASSDGVVVDVAIGAVAGVRVDPVGKGAMSVTTGFPATLLARCRELTQANVHAEIGRRTLPPIRGSIAAANATHVELEGSGGVHWLVPFAEIAWVSPTGQ